MHVELEQNGGLVLDGELVPDGEHTSNGELVFGIELLRMLSRQLFCEILQRELDSRS